ncbi:NAD(P)-binding domain-containing protein [Nocardioides salsibiostraticola]
MAASVTGSAEPVLDVAVVGAGPAGLLLARRLHEAGVAFEVFERHGDVGGIWDIDAPGSPMYESAHFISSKTHSGFPGFPMPEEFPDYPNHRQLLGYIRSYADRFDLRRHIRFRSEVLSAETSTDGLWRLTFADGEQRSARYLVAANGVTWERNEITWSGEFTGEIRHSATYRSTEEFRGRRVLIVGAGNSGVDIACDAAFAADQAFLSLRRGYHFLPKHIMGQPTDVFAETGPRLPWRLQRPLFAGLLRVINGRPEQYGLPRPDHRLLDAHPIMNTQILHYLGHGDCRAKADVARLDGQDVVFVDGSRERIDLIIQATGYHHACPFLAEGVLDQRDGRPDLYLGIFARRQPHLAVLGFVEFASAAYANFDRMAELIVSDVTADPNSERARVLADLKATHRPDLKGGRSYVRSERHANYVEVETYLATLGSVRERLANVR